MTSSSLDVQDIHWHDFEAHLHPYVKKRLLGRFAAEVGSATEKQVREQGERMLRDSLAQHRHEQMKEALGQAKSNGRGVTGLRRVLRSLEMGEVQVLLMAENYSAHAVECTSCGHLDAHMVQLLSGLRPRARKSWKMCAKPLFRRPSGATLNWCM